MKAARVIGCVMASQKPESMTGVKLLVLKPAHWDGREARGDILIAADTVGTGAGELVFYVEARDASIAVSTQPPIDAAIVGIIDQAALES